MPRQINIADNQIVVRRYRRLQRVLGIRAAVSRLAPSSSQEDARPAVVRLLATALRENSRPSALACLDRPVRKCRAVGDPGAAGVWRQHAVILEPGARCAAIGLRVYREDLDLRAHGNVDETERNPGLVGHLYIARDHTGYVEGKIPDVQEFVTQAELGAPGPGWEILNLGSNLFDRSLREATGWRLRVGGDEHAERSAQGDGGDPGEGYRYSLRKQANKAL